MRKLFLLLPTLLLSMTLSAQTKDDIATAMKRATHYMMDKASYRGGFVWNYLPDYSRQWGEMEAKRTMIWLQAPSTPDVGQLLLDAYHATGDEYYYKSAQRVAQAVMDAQYPSGGWNYLYHYEGVDSTKAWYNTIGRQAWRLEEFQHYYGNATFDDEATMHCANFLLRLYLEKKDPTYKEPLDRVINFTLESQYANGGWPQRYPLNPDHPFKGKADYTPFVTINDDVLPSNIDFLMHCYTLLGRKDLREPVERAMNLSASLQYKKPLAGWTDQYTPDDLDPAHARSYEPRAINTGTTAGMIRSMIDYYKMTGDRKFIAGVPDAIQFIAHQALSDSVIALSKIKPRTQGDILAPRYVDPDTYKPLYVHRRGSNVMNGEYYINQDIRNTIRHYNSMVVINIPALQKLYEEALKLDQDSLQQHSPLITGTAPLPEYYYQRSDNGYRRQMPMPDASKLILSLTPEGYWLTRLSQISKPFKPLPKSMKKSYETKYADTMVGDEYDTSPYNNEEGVMGISTQAFIMNMTQLIKAYRESTKTLSGLYPDKFHSNTEGKQTGLFTLRNSNGAEACITNYGARLVSLMEPNWNGRFEDVVLGYDNIDDYMTRGQNFGSTVGRYIGRINGSKIVIDGKESLLKVGSNGVISHGGRPGFANRVWDVVKTSNQCITLRYISPDGENGFPGELTTTVTYTLRDDNAIGVTYEATTTKPTVINLSNHSFFNISGDLNKNVLGQHLWIDSHEITEYDHQKNVTGRFLKTHGTPFDFTKPHEIGERIDADNAQLHVTGGYDHAYRLRHAGNENKPAAILYDAPSGRALTVYTTEPALQIYTGNGLKGTEIGKNGIRYMRRSAICLETMHFSDSPHQPQFPSTVLRPGEKYRSHTVFLFTTDPPVIMRK
jgi:PelA/Pel-15E family pectate lyase